MSSAFSTSAIVAILKSFSNLEITTHAAADMAEAFAN